MKDPVCGMEIEARRWSASHAGVEYVFCSEGCLEIFLAGPERCFGPPEQRRFDLVIVGGGPAGLTAGVYASLQRLDALLLAPELGGQAADSSKISNYMGFDLITGPELLQRFRDQLLQSHFLSHRLDEVLRVDSIDGGFSLQTRAGIPYETTAIIVATGMHRRRLGVPGEQRLLHRGVSYHHTQELGRFGGRPVAVVGGGNSGVQAAIALAQVQCQVTLISEGPLTGDPADVAQLRESDAVRVLTGHEVTEVQGREQVEEIGVRPRAGGDERHLPVAGVFIEIGYFPNADCVAHLVRLNRQGEIVTGANGATTVPGIFAAGDVTDGGGKRIIIAAGDGARAALGAGIYLRAEKAVAAKSRS